MARANIVASVQPCHLLGDIANADRHWPHARQHAFAFRQLLDLGVTLAGGSDVPVEPIDPRRSLFAATARVDHQGQPPGGWFPRQRVTVREAINMFTRGAAAAIGAAEPVGTIAVDAPADLTIWGQDPYRTPPADLPHARILGCVVDGQVHLSPDA